MADDGHVDPRCALPDGLVRARRVDPEDPRAPSTWRVANGPRWHRVGPGLYVPADRPRCVEQRIVEAGSRVATDGTGGCLTGWAALRLRGATFFDGVAPGGGERPIELAMCARSQIRTRPGDAVVARRFFVPGWATTAVAGVALAPVPRALFDEVRVTADLVRAVQAVDMASAAGLISVRIFRDYVDGCCNNRTGVERVRRAMALARDGVLSPPETRVRLTWVCDLELGRPLVNVPVFDRAGRLLGVPDLLDPRRAIAVEYDGAAHRSRERHRHDVQREERLREAGIDVVRIVAGDRRDVVTRRLVAACRRAESRGVAGDARWTLEPPSWYVPPPDLTARLVESGEAAQMVQRI